MYKDLKIYKILVGIDGSGYSLRALEFSKNLARKYNSQIIAFTAFNIPDIYKIFEKKKITTPSPSKKKFTNQRDYYQI